jgi:hypothetical protein
MEGGTTEGDSTTDTTGTTGTADAGTGITDADRITLVRASLAKVGRDDLQAALDRGLDPSISIPTPVANALKALRKHRDPVSVLDKPQYRPALPFVSAAMADACLTRTIEVLGDHSDDPTREQLLEALDEVRETYSDVIVGVMLASVADGEMPASDLCFDIATTDERYGLADRTAFEPASAPARPAVKAPHQPTVEQREARRLKKQREAEERRRKMEAARKAGEQVRRARKLERTSSAADESRPAVDAAPGRGSAPRLTRRAVLTPAQEEEFDRGDPWTAGVVFAWVPFAPDDPDAPRLEGKSRRCVVVAGSADQLLVRPGFSEGGVKSRDWKSVALRHWKRAGFDQPTWIDGESIRVPRGEVEAPLGWLSPEDWNALW